MDKTKLIKKLALYAAYALFAGFSAYFTATSFSLNLLHTDELLVLSLCIYWCSSSPSWQVGV